MSSITHIISKGHPVVMGTIKETQGNPDTLLRTQMVSELEANAVF